MSIRLMNVIVLICIITSVVSTTSIDHQNRLVRLASALQDLSSDELDLARALSDLASSETFKKDSDRFQHVERLYGQLAAKSHQLWNDNRLSGCSFFESWLILGDRVNQLARSFPWMPCREIPSYNDVCVKQFQALHATMTLITSADDAEMNVCLSAPVCSTRRRRIAAPLQILWLDLAQDAMVKFHAAQGQDTDQVVQEIKETAEKLKSAMPRAIPRDHLYQSTETERQRYEKSDEVCPICYEKIGAGLGERLHCEYSCGNRFHRKCILSYLKIRGLTIKAPCPFGCRWPALYAAECRPAERNLRSQYLALRRRVSWLARAWM